jgi:hypothetical protein
MARAKHDWAKLDPHIDNLKAQGRTNTQIAKELSIGRQTLIDHLRSRELVHPSTLNRTTEHWYTRIVAAPPGPGL